MRTPESVNLKRDDFLTGAWVQQNKVVGGHEVTVDRDMKSDQYYMSEGTGSLRFQAVWLTIATPITQAIAAVANIVVRALATITLFRLWESKDGEYDLKERVKSIGKDLLIILAQPAGIIGLQLSAIYGIISPKDGRKLYASIERALYGNNAVFDFLQPVEVKDVMGSQQEVAEPITEYEEL